MTHKHHIIPKYRGGSDRPDNLVEVDVTRHAMFHYCNWKLWGDRRDWFAWKGLVCEIPKRELIQRLMEEGARRGTLSAMSTQARLKRKKTLAAIKHQQGESNSQYGTMWITDGETNKKIRKTEPIPEGYYKGRKLK